MIHIAAPEIGTEEIAAVNEVLQSGMLAQGPKVSELEASFAEYCGTKYAAAISSGTAALHVALHAAGIGPGDEVITTPFSFIATINPILFVGAKPVLVDIAPETFMLDVSKVEAAITKKTKAIMPVHLYGQAANMAEVQALADKYSLKIIEDACQAIGADYGSKKAGNLGDLGCFSLYATKNIMSGEGGMITTNNEDYLNNIKQFRQHGMTGPYEYADIGYNYRLTDLQAAIAIEQIKKVERFTASRQKTAQLFNDGLKYIKGLTLPKVAPNRNHVYHQYTIRVDKDFPLSREELVARLKEREIGAGIYYPKALHLYPHIARIGYKPGDFPEAERAGREVLSLPIHPKVTAANAQTIIDAFKELAHA
jgi:dTDP-4-amino-4,6-dideoxygalactose transaminase